MWSDSYFTKFPLDFKTIGCFLFTRPHTVSPYYQHVNIVMVTNSNWHAKRALVLLLVKLNRNQPKLKAMCFSSFDILALFDKITCECFILPLHSRTTQYIGYLICSWPQAKSDNFESTKNWALYRPMLLWSIIYKQSWTFMSSTTFEIIHWNVALCHVLYIYLTFYNNYYYLWPEKFAN